MQNQSETPRKNPIHIGIIMDGNGRWAKKRGLPRLKGHYEGANNVRKILDAAIENSIKYLTLFAFSTENWQRPSSEVEGLMNLLSTFLAKHTDELVEKQTRLRVIGDYKVFPKKVVKALDHAIEITEGFNDHQLVLALNYSSRAEILKALPKILEDANNGAIDVEALTWKTLSKYLQTRDLPDPDLIIRTSGERRLSNFLLLQGAYSEIYISPVLWPDFKKEHFIEALNFYATRERRFGKTADQLSTISRTNFIPDFILK